MKENNLISTQTLCSHYDIEFSFFAELNKTGLLQIEIIGPNQFIHQNQINDLEKMIRMRHELNINIEGIDVIFNLLEKERILQNELNVLRNRLKLYENS